MLDRLMDIRMEDLIDMKLLDNCDMMSIARRILSNYYANKDKFLKDKY